MKVEEKNGKIYIDGLDIIQVLSNYEKECNKLKEENQRLKESIVNEATLFCDECASKECCPEKECVLYRIEELCVDEQVRDGK